MTDNDDLIEQLRHTLHAHTDDAEMPERFAERARSTAGQRAARRRTARRAAAAGAPLLAAAGVGIVLVTGANSGRGSPRTESVPQVTSGAGQAQDTAYIVGRVSANVAADSRDGIVIQDSDYAGGQITSHGALRATTSRLSTGYTYDAPDGAVYWRSSLLNDDGMTRFAESNRWLPTADGKYAWTALVINPATRTYTQHQRIVDAPFEKGPAPNIDSRPSAVRRALAQGQVTRLRTATIGRRRAIVLSVTRPAKDGVLTQRLILDVDARTLQPLRTIAANRFGVLVEDWLAPTAHNIARAKDQAIPAGYRRVARAY